MGRAITDLVDVVRSKNAGPYELTFDLIFKDEAGYNLAKETGLISQELISRLYQIPTQDVVSIIYFDPARAIKITIVRPLSAGAVGERDVYGAQQHAPLLSIEI